MMIVLITDLFWINNTLWLTQERPTDYKFLFNNYLPITLSIAVVTTWLDLFSVPSLCSLSLRTKIWCSLRIRISVKKKKKVSWSIWSIHLDTWTSHQRSLLPFVSQMAPWSLLIVSPVSFIRWFQFLNKIENWSFFFNLNRLLWAFCITFFISIADTEKYKKLNIIF